MSAKRTLRCSAGMLGMCLCVVGALAGGGAVALGATGSDTDAKRPSAVVSSGSDRDLSAEPLTATELLEDLDAEDDAACRACHEGLHETMADATLLSAVHQDIPCTVCHVQDDAYQAAHEDAGENTEKKLKKLRTLKSTQVSSDACRGCHGVEEGIAARTAACEVLTDKNGLVVNPHEVETTLNTNNQHSTVQCASCHTVHTAKSTVQEESERVCMRCHHTGTYECYTCHS